MMTSRRALTGTATGLDAVAQAVQRQEGYYPGTLAYTNNNPGNLRYAGQAGASGADSSGFAIFPTYAAGYQALQNQISLQASEGQTLSQFVNQYAPPNENNTSAYLANMSSWLGASGGESLNDIISGSPVSSSPSGSAASVFVPVSYSTAPDTSASADLSVDDSADGSSSTDAGVLSGLESGSPLLYAGIGVAGLIAWLIWRK